MKAQLEDLAFAARLRRGIDASPGRPQMEDRLALLGVSSASTAAFADAWPGAMPGRSRL
jgi:hypothetical protein